ncbi:MAG: hypothetical protein IT287_02510, partial [Bdellovibrionaceae bacterium]|nr:hypothetical protein [Pseudobdellovibrionaceae bacterium]
MLKKTAIALTSIFFLIVSTVFATYLFRKPIALWAITSYAHRQQLNLKLDIKTLEWNEVLIENLIIEDG